MGTDPDNITQPVAPEYDPNGTNTSQLNLHRSSLEEEFRQHPPISKYAKYYDGFSRFKNAIIETLQKVNDDPDYRKELQSLLTLKFQTFENSQIYQV